MLSTARFGTLTHEIRRVEGSQKNAKKLFKKLVGYIFEEMAYLTVANQIQVDTEIWSPVRTRRFFSELYPHKKLLRFGFQETIEDQFVPDGLKVQTDENGVESVDEMLEYTSRVKPYQLFDALDVKYAAFLREREMHPSELGQSRLHFVVPSNADLSLITGSHLYNDVRISFMPFSSHDLAKYVAVIARKHANTKPQKMSR